MLIHISMTRLDNHRWCWFYIYWRYSHRIVIRYDDVNRSLIRRASKIRRYRTAKYDQHLLHTVHVTWTWCICESMYMNTKIYVYYVQFNHVGVKDLTFVVTAKMSSRTLVLFCTRSFFYCLKSCFNKSKNICIITYRVELSHRMTKNGLYLCSWVLHFVDFSRSFLKILKIS